MRVCQTTMGKVGGILALIGVIVCPISSGDTAYRSARLTLADWFKIDQADWKKRLLVTVPLLGAGLLISRLDYSVVWRYFSWSNQTLAMIALWAISMYLFKSGKNWRLTSIPAFVMSAVTTTYFVSAPECLGHIWGAFGIQQSTYYPIACAVGAAAAVLFWIIFRRGALKAEKISSGETPPHP